MSENWTQSEVERRKQVEAGETVVANIMVDKQLIAWAKKNKLYRKIGRPTRWGNPFVLGKHGDRPTCIANYQKYFLEKKELHEQLDDLKQKVLGCYCYPESCHGHVLVKFLKTRPKTHGDLET